MGGRKRTTEGELRVVRAEYAAERPSIRGQIRTFGPEAEGSIRERIADPMRVAAIMRAWSVLQVTMESPGIREDWYPKAHRAAAELDYGAEDVLAFSKIAVPRDRDESGKLGFFLSALINQGQDRTYMIEPPSELDYLGWKNKKEVIIETDVGDYCAHEMSVGKILVKGDARHSFADHMSGGSAELLGKAQCAACNAMSGGNVLFHSDIGNMTWNLSGGEVEVIGSVLGEAAGKGGRMLVRGNVKVIRAMGTFHIDVQGDVGQVHCWENPEIWIGGTLEQPLRDQRRNYYGAKSGTVHLDGKGSIIRDGLDPKRVLVYRKGLLVFGTNQDTAAMD